MGTGITFSSWLKQRRGELGVTQAALAEHINYALATVQKIEAGDRRPSSQVIQLLAEYFRVPADERAAFTSFARGGAASVADLTAPDGTGMGAPWRNAHVRRTNVPAVLTSLIGRKEEQTAARDALLQPNVRLLTLTGPPGIGKTRLALEVASGLVEHFEDGVFWVELAAVVDPELVPATVARALGVKQAAGSPPEELLLDYVRARKMLLLLDNFEQVLDAATSVVQLMQASPWLKVLVTSREALHVRGERRLAVPPLALPDPAPFAAAGLAHGRQVVPLPRADVLRNYPAIQLFVERARSVSPAFELTPENAGDIAAVCIELDGVPLAIELAAGRATHFSLGAMRAALRHRLTLLTGGARDLPARHQTLRNAIAWSYALLDPAEQMTFRALGVFSSAPTLEAVEAARAAGSSTRAKDSLHALVDKNLVRRLDPDGDRPTARFSMSPAIQEYALDRLNASGEEDAARRRHAEYYLALAEEAEPHLTDAAQETWLKRLEQEHDNLRLALQWIALHAARPGATSIAEVDISMAELGLRLAGALWPFWDVAGYWSEGRQQLATVLAFPIPPAASGRLQRPRAKTLAGAASLAQEQGDYRETVALFGESLAIRREIGDKQGVASTLNSLGSVAFEQGDYAQAGVFYGESLAIRRELGDRRAIASSLNNLGLIALEQGAYGDAGALYAESLAFQQEVGDAGGIAISLNNLAHLAGLQLDYARASALHTESLAIKRQLGNKRGIGVSLGNLGLVAFEQGDYAQAGAMYRESLALRCELGDKAGVAYCLIALGGLAAAAQEPQRGATLLGAATAHLEGTSVVLQSDDREMYDRGIASARAQLDDAAFEAAWAAGRALPSEDAIDYALALGRVGD